MAVDPAPARRYFISHSSRDKELALGLRDELDDHAWVDLYEIELGEVLLDAIAAGIEAATDFVLLWSKDSADSKWVQFEFHMAFIRHLEDSAITIRILRLDDTPLPLHFRPFLHARNVTSASQAASLLRGAAPRVPTLRAFVNRNAEIDAVESSLYSPRVGHVWLWGMTGIGKRAIAREALRRVIADSTRVRSVEIRAGTGFVELDLIVSAALGLATPLDTLSETDAETRTTEAIASYAESGGIWAFSEVQYWLDEDGEANIVLRAVLRALERAGTWNTAKLAVFTTTRRPSLDGIASTHAEMHRVGGLGRNFGVALLRARGGEAPEDVLGQAADELDGHPLALEIVAPQLGEEAPNWEDFRASAATGVVSGLDLHPLTATLLERLAAVDGPLPAEQYAQHLRIDSDDLQRAIEEGAAYSLIEQSEHGFLRLHPLVRDLYMRAFRRDENFISEAGDLASRARTYFEATTPGSPTYVDALVMTFRLLCWAGQLREAIDLRQNLYGTLYETAVELYNQRRYKDALRYFEIVIESTNDNRNAKLFLARTLAYVGELERARNTVDEILEASPDDHHAWRIRGRVEFIARQFKSAITYYERANELKQNVVGVLRDLGQARMRVGDWYGARAALQAAMGRQRRDPDPYLAFQYSQVLEHFGEFDEARRVITQAIRRDPENVGFHHRLGRIAEALGDRVTAAREYEQCLKLDPNYVESLVSLASLEADAGNLAGARARLKRAQRTPNARKAVLLNVEAKILLKDRDFEGARRAVEEALTEDREVVSLHLAARIELEAIAAGTSRCSDVSHSVRRYAEEIRITGRAEEADALLQDLASACQ